MRFHGPATPYVHTYMHKYIHTYIRTFTHACMHACMHSCMHANKLSQPEGSQPEMRSYGGLRLAPQGEHARLTFPSGLSSRYPTKSNANVRAALWNFLENRLREYGASASRSSWRLLRWSFRNWQWDRTPRPVRKYACSQKRPSPGSAVLERQALKLPPFVKPFTYTETPFRRGAAVGGTIKPSQSFTASRSPAGSPEPPVLGICPRPCGFTRRRPAPRHARMRRAGGFEP